MSTIVLRMNQNIDDHKQRLEEASVMVLPWRLVGGVDPALPEDGGVIFTCLG